MGEEAGGGAGVVGGGEGDVLWVAAGGEFLAGVGLGDDGVEGGAEGAEGGAGGFGFGVQGEVECVDDGAGAEPVFDGGAEGVVGPAFAGGDDADGAGAGDGSGGAGGGGGVAQASGEDGGCAGCERDGRAVG